MNLYNNQMEQISSNELVPTSIMGREGLPEMILLPYWLYPKVSYICTFSSIEFSTYLLFRTCDSFRPYFQRLRLRHLSDSCNPHIIFDRAKEEFRSQILEHQINHLPLAERQVREFVTMGGTPVYALTLEAWRDTERLNKNGISY